MSLINFHESGFYCLDSLRDDEKLKDLVTACINLQRRKTRPEDRAFQHGLTVAKDNVSEESLQRILGSGQQVSDLSSTKELSNCIVFLTKSASQNHVPDTEIITMRNRIEEHIRRVIPDVFENPPRLIVENSGHFWYPPGGFMGWHTNSNSPGWRLYVSFADEPRKSFFRYRDPVTGDIHTSLDEYWDFRLFSIEPNRDFWHAVYSDSNRFSIGFRIRQQPSLVSRAANKGKAVLRKLRSRV